MYNTFDIGPLEDTTPREISDSLYASFKKYEAAQGWEVKDSIRRDMRTIAVYKEDGDPFLLIMKLNELPGELKAIPFVGQLIVNKNVDMDLVNKILEETDKCYFKPIGQTPEQN